MIKPNFLICGTQKGGTKALLQYLVQHPEISMYPNEINYFSWEYDKDDSWYTAHFSENKFVGEKSPSYMLIPEVPERIHKFDSEMKLIFILRNPIDRAYSHYWMNVRRGKETRSFSQAIREPELENKYGINMYLSRGKYKEKLDRFRKYFPEENMLVLSSEELRNDTDSSLLKVQRFLGFGDFDFDTSINTKVGNKPKSRYVTKMLQYRGIRNFPFLGNCLLLFNNRSEPYPPMKNEDRKFLEEYYAEK